MFAVSRKTAVTLMLLGLSTDVSYGADLGSLITKAPPEIAPLTFNGFTLYGLIDVSAHYESHGVPLNGPVPSALGIIAPQNRAGSMWLLAPNEASQSFVGLKYERQFDFGMTLLAKAETGFVPTTGHLADGLASLRLNNGIPLSQQTANGDSGRAGQLVNGELWIGASGAYGNLYVGRLNALSLEMIGKYDPLNGSYGFSLVGYVGSLAGGGSTEDFRVDQAVKYTYAYGPVHVAGLYAAPDTNVKSMWQAYAGIDYAGFSLDFLAGQVKDAVSAASLSGPAFVGSQFLGGRIFDATTYGVFGKYKAEIGSTLQDDGAQFKRSITFSGAFARIDYSNPSDGGYGVGHSTIGGYQLGPQLSTTGLAGGGVVNYAYTGGNRFLDVYFAGFKYQHDPKWSLSGAYYRFNQNSFGFGVANLGFYNGFSYSKVSCSTSSFTNCSGKEQVASVRADYLWTKNLNLYAGGAWSRVDDGLAFGYQNREMYSTSLGVKFLF